MKILFTVTTQINNKVSAFHSLPFTLISALQIFHSHKTAQRTW